MKSTLEVLFIALSVSVISTKLLGLSADAGLFGALIAVGSFINGKVKD